MRAIAETASDEQLMSELCAGSGHDSAGAVFDEIFRRYHTRVVLWCWRMVRDRDTASDLAQEVFMKVWRRRETFRGDSRLSTWLYAVTRNHCLTALRKQAGDAVQFEVTLLTTLRDPGAVGPEHAAGRGELHGQMIRLMRRTLEPMEMRVMTLHYGYDVPLADITRDLGLRNPSGAKAYIVNARRKLFTRLRCGGTHTTAEWRGRIAA